MRKCVNKKTGEACAVKSISKKRIHRPEVLTREIDILKQVKHENIISIRDVYEDDQHVFIVTELCTGGELFDHIIEKTKSKEGHYSEKDAARLIRQMLRAIAYCHERHIVHRDLKPENFLFTCKDESVATLKIIDFGLATEQHAEAAGGPMEHMHTRVGTPYYIAPEVLQRDYTAACDLWSVGVVAYILLCGYPPFNGATDTEIFASIKKGVTGATFPAEDWGSVSPAGTAFIKNLFDVDPSKRATAAAALSDPWLADLDDDGDAAVAPAGALNGDALATRFTTFVGLSRLKKAALNVLAHHLTEREIAELARIWSKIDVDGSGTISIDQLYATLRDNGHRATEEEMDAYTTGLDIHHDLRQHVDGFDYYEFAAAMLSRNQTIRDDRLKEVFETMDEGNKGFITLQNLEHIMGSEAHAAEVMGEVAEAVAASGGKLTFDVLKSQLAKVPTLQVPKPPTGSPGDLPEGKAKSTIMTATL